ncbi:single-stranded DNA-binding protein [Pediococcus inopinatus]|uniref:single-stranded DNA-binding protein n=1 Tax=Pediococcus inopinatus TaxID=114090 RepID=UPI002B26063F|nr:single-stranded DNA-binding protein [Pediococcus inopinatus]WPC19473.1 single-stranded DNA-binding protein [Pediococcus inopinatus]
MNLVEAIGRLTKDPELRYTNSGKAVARFTLAVNRNFKNASGEYEADFINCTIWNKGAENLSNQVSKGTQIGIDGRIQTGSYDNDQGTRIFTTDVIVNNYYLIGSRSDNQEGNNGGQRSNYAQQPQQNNQLPKNDPFAGSDPVEVSDDSLPF